VQSRPRAAERQVASGEAASAEFKSRPFVWAWKKGFENVCVGTRKGTSKTRELGLFHKCARFAIGANICTE
jgi:hypothetical protein